MNHPTTFKIEFEQEEDGRWIAEILGIPGALSYGDTQEEAEANVKALALRVLADRLEHRETTLTDLSFVAVAA